MEICFDSFGNQYTSYQFSPSVHPLLLAILRSYSVSDHCLSIKCKQGSSQPSLTSFSYSLPAHFIIVTTSDSWTKVLSTPKCLSESYLSAWNSLSSIVFLTLYLFITVQRASHLLSGSHDSSLSCSCLAFFYYFIYHTLGLFVDILLFIVIVQYLCRKAKHIVDFQYVFVE